MHRNKAITGRATRKSERSRYNDTLNLGDIADVVQYAVVDVLIPTVKRAVSDIVSNGVNILLGLDIRSKPNSGYTPYRSSYGTTEPKKEPPRANMSKQYSYETLYYDTRGDAEKILYLMRQMLRECDGFVSVADMFDMAGVSCDYTDNKYGWDDLHEAKVVPSRYGFSISLPAPKPIR